MTPCSIDGCDRKHKARGFCKLHYARFWATGTPESPRNEPCDYGPCDANVSREGLCERHWWRQHNGVPLDHEPPECSIQGCDNPSRLRGWCDLHYFRWYRGRDMYAPPPISSRTFAKGHHVEQPDGCWIWRGALDRDGYGRVTVDTVAWAAHRYYYTEHNGPIGDGMEVDHLCNIRACVNPAHLEAVTREENQRRAVIRRGHKFRKLRAC